MNLFVNSLLINELKSISFPESLGHRAVGDQLESDSIDIIRDNFPDSFREASSKRSIEDLTIVHEGVTHLFDVKTHFIQQEGFSMPNLISIDRLRSVLADPSKTLSYIFIDYKRDGESLTIEDVKVKYVWELDWSMLRIGALGKGQLQIKDANQAPVFTDIGKSEWFSILRVKARDYYQKELSKTKKLLDSW